MNRQVLKVNPAVVCILLVLTQRTEALVYCVTNAVDEHRIAPTGDRANSGWNETAQIGDFLGTLIHSNAMLTAKHLNFGVDVQFYHEGVTHTVTTVANDAESDFTVLFFTPPVTNIAYLNIETNDICSEVVLQGRGMERGAEVIRADGQTNGWEWAKDKWWSIRRWGVNRYEGEAEGGLLAVAAFDNTGDPDECMLSPGDSGGPGFIRSGSGWKLATVNYAVDPTTFTLSTNPVASFEASLYDCAGLYFDNSGTWSYVPPEASPAPCIMVNTRVSQRISWITNTVAGITFPADIGVAWRCETNLPSASKAAEGLWFEVIVTNAGPYTARDLAFDITWPSGVRQRTCTASQGTCATNRWSLPALADGGTATLRVDTVVWRSNAGWGTNRVSVTGSDKPDNVTTNNSDACAVFLPATATRFMVE